MFNMAVMRESIVAGCDDRQQMKGIEHTVKTDHLIIKFNKQQIELRKRVSF